MAIRLMHEAQLHERNSFITLTYNDESLATRRPRGNLRFPTPSLRVHRRATK